MLLNLNIDWYLEKYLYCEYGGEGIISISQDLIESNRPRKCRSQADRETKSKTQTDVDPMSL